MGLRGRINQVAEAIPGGGGEFHFIVLQHTDCGITRLANDPALLTRFFQIPEQELKTKAVSDPGAAVAVDVASLWPAPAISSSSRKTKAVLREVSLREPPSAGL